MAFSVWTTTGGAIVAVILLVWFYLETQFKNRVRLKEIVNGRVLIRDYRARSYTDKDKSVWWRLAGERRKDYKLIPMPPEESIEISVKGKKYVEGYRFETGEVVFITDQWKAKKVPDFSIVPDNIKKKIEDEKDYQKKKEIQDRWRRESIEKWKKDNNVIAPYQPVTTNQRIGYFNNIKKAESRKGFDWKAQLIPIASISGIVIIVLALIIMFGEIARPVLEADKIAENTISMQREIVNLLKDINNNQQTINSEMIRLNNKVDSANKNVPD